MGQHHGISCFTARETLENNFYGFERNIAEFLYKTGGVTAKGLRREDGFSRADDGNLDAPFLVPSGSMIGVDEIPILRAEWRYLERNRK